MTKDKKSADGGPHSTAGGGRNGPATVTDAVGRKLKSSYSELLREPIPEKFLQLLQQLDEGAGEKAGSDPAEKSADTAEQAQRGAAAEKKSIAKDEN